MDIIPHKKIVIQSKDIWIKQGLPLIRHWTSNIGVSEELVRKDLELENFDKVISNLKERKRNEKRFLVTSGIEEADLLPVSFLEVGAKQSLAVCRICRYFSCKSFKYFLDDVKRAIIQWNITDNFNSVAKIKEIFSIPDRVANDIEGLKDSNSDSDEEKFAEEKLAISLENIEALKNISENLLIKINPIPIGTGFLVGGTHLLTNNHVLPNRETAERCVAQFNYVEDEQGSVQTTVDYEFDPAALFVTEPNLDYTLVQLKSDMFTRPAGYKFGWIHMTENDENICPGLSYLSFDEKYWDDLKESIENLQTEGFTVKREHLSGEEVLIIWHRADQKTQIGRKFELLEKELRKIKKDLQVEQQPIYLRKRIKGDSVLVIQHPKGKRKQFGSIRSNEVMQYGLLKNFLRYKTDTDYGSSGSPVFNQRWELVALHHAAIPETIPDSEEQKKKSQPVKFECEQGVRICRIVEDLKKKSTSNPKLASFIADFVITSEQLNYPPFSSGIQFNGINDYISVDGRVAFASCATNFAGSSDRQSTDIGISTIKLWNSKGIELKTCVHPGVRKIEFSPDGKLLASAGGADKIIKLWNLEDGTLFKNLSIEDPQKKESEIEYQQQIQIDTRIRSLSFSPPNCPLGKVLASAARSSTVKLWNLENGTLLETPTELVGEKVGFSPDGKTLISAGSFSPSTIKIWNLENKIIRETSSEHIRYVESISFSDDSKILATGNGNIDGNIEGTLDLWNLETGELRHTLTDHTGSVFSVKFNSDKTLLSVGGDWTIRRWSLDGQSLGEPIRLHPQPNRPLQKTNSLTGETPIPQEFLEKSNSVKIQSASFSPDGKTLATCLTEDSITLWKVEDGSMLRSLKHFRDNVSSNDDTDLPYADVSFNPNVCDLCSADWNESNSSESVTIEAWVSPDLDGGGTIASLSLKASDGESCQFSLNITPIDENCGYVGFNFSGSRSGGGIVFFGKFSHVAATINFTNQEIKLYVNGRGDDDQEFTISQKSFSTNASSFSPHLTLIGAFLENTAPVLRDFFKGCITEVRLWKVALTEEQIKANMFRRLTIDNSNWSDLVGYWRFEECPDDRVYNLVSQDEYGAICGAKWLRASQYPALPMPYGLRFNEENNRIECTTKNLDTPKAITVEAWVKHKFGNCLIVSRGGIVGSNGTVEKGYSLAWVDGKIRVALSDGSSKIVVYSQDNAPRDRIWHHVAFSWDKISQEVALYIDGRRQNSLIEGQSETIFSEGQYKTIGLFSGSLDSLTKPLKIGLNESAESYYDVAIAEVRLWNLVRTQDLIKSQMSRRLKPEKEEGLIGYWRLDDGGEDNDQVLDLSSNQNHGKIHGTKICFPPIPAGKVMT